MKELSCCPSCQTLPASQVTLLCFFSPSSVGTRVLTPHLPLAKTFPFLSLESSSCHIPLPLDFLCGYRSSPQAQHALCSKALQGHQHCKTTERWDDLALWCASNQAQQEEYVPRSPPPPVQATRGIRGYLQWQAGPFSLLKCIGRSILQQKLSEFSLTL